MGIAALGFCSFEGMHCEQVVIQHNATPPLPGDLDKSSTKYPTVQVSDTTKASFIFCRMVHKAV